MVLELLSGRLELATFVMWGVALFVAISVHEFSHAFAADRLGDPTARYHGRLSLNPRAHLDPVGTLLILLFGFGWGKPVPFDPTNLYNPKRDSALIALAGPASNLLVALTLGALLRTFGGILVLTIPIIALNINLGVFNLLPIFPLDGFKIVGGFLPYSQALSWQGLERYGLLILLFLMLPFGGGPLLISLIHPPISLLLRLTIGL